MIRSLIDIGALDVRMQEEVAQYGDIRDLGVVLWKQTPDGTGCNWNARVARVRGDSATDERWWGVVPLMRERFNLT